MSDPIDRQAAIDALGDKPLAWTEGEYELGLQQQWEADVNAIKVLPSAQPEIIRCKNCAKREYCRTSTVWAVPPSDDWFCGDAEPYKGEQECTKKI